MRLPYTNVYLSGRSFYLLVDVGPTERTVDDLANEIRIGHFFSHSEPDKLQIDVSAEEIVERIAQLKSSILKTDAAAKPAAAARTQGTPPPEAAPPAP